MRKKELLFKNEVTLDDDRMMRLEYNLIENRSTNNEEPYYGIQIIKYVDDNLEMDEVSGVSYSMDKVKTITKILFQHVVTPISLVEIIDDLVTLEAV
jgi:hypothetical protein